VIVTFTALHRACGFPPGPLTDEILDAAVTAGVSETDDLDWKSELPPAKGLPQTDFPKDVAAMANSGGGIIVYGVLESQKAATKRVDVGELDEAHERALRSAAVTAISPPVFGLIVHRLGPNPKGERAVVVEVPASVDGPHLIYRGEFFGAPIRNNADTVWMRERQIEVMYRARFDERRRAVDALDTLSAETSAGRDTDTRAWVVTVAHPRIPRVGDRLSRDDARSVLQKAEALGRSYTASMGIHPLQNVDLHNPRPGLRRWIAVNTATSERSAWKESWVSIHHDGSVTLAAAIGGHRVSSDTMLEGWQVAATSIECAVADLLALARVAAEATGRDEYDVRVAINWTGVEPLEILGQDPMGFLDRRSPTPLHGYTPVETTINAAAPDLDYYWHVHNLAEDCVNQGGVAVVRLIHPPSRT